MKKAMIVAVAMVCAIAAKSATVTWGAMNASTVDATKITTGTMYLMYTSGTADFTKFTGQSSFSADTLAAAGFTTTVDSFAYSSTSYSKKNTGVTPAATGLSAGTYDMYTILISDDGKYVAYGESPASVKIAATAGQNQGKTTGAFTYVEAASAPTPPTPAVPEPTSGVLMLVGMGVLALRRKRA